jgi:hypothetical protein
LPRFQNAYLAEFGSIPAEVWENGALPVRSLMQTREWLAAAAEVYGEGGRTKVLIAGPADAPRALALLGRPSAFGGYRLLGAIDVGESVEVMWADEDALDQLARGLTRLGAAVDLGHYPKGADFARRLRRMQRWRGLTLVRSLPQRALPALPLTEDWSEPLKLFSRSRRQRFRRKWRKAEAIGPVEVEILCPSPEDLGSQISRAMAVEAKSWKGRAGTALLQDPRQAEFFRAFGRRMIATGRLRLCFLTIGGQDAAMEYAAVWKNRFWSIKLGYDESFGAVSPGEALRVELMRHCAQQGYEAIEFCGKEAPWTAAWTDQAVEIQALRVYPWTPRGIAGLASDAWGIGLRRLQDRMASASDQPGA